MRKWIVKVLFCLVFLGVFTGKVRAVDYEISNFESVIRLERNSDLRVREKIDTNFFIEKHGIYRIIPYIYSHNGKTIKADLKIVGVKNEKGDEVSYSVENYYQSKKIKIGEAATTVIGPKSYIIEYTISDVVLDYGEGPEIYWNVTGEEWDVPMDRVKARVESPFGKITKVECFGCQNSFSEKEAVFEGQRGLTIVAQIDKINSLKKVGVIEKIIKFIMDNWGYVVALAPLLLMLYFWYSKGRDKRYLSENVFYKENKERVVGIWERKHLPLVYQEINGLSPLEVGFILDEKADIKDIVAEILELGRLKYLKIEKIEKKGFFGRKSDYKFTKNKKETSPLKEHQQYLLESLFETKDEVLVSELKDKFYVHLKPLKEKVYQSLIKMGAIPDDPEKVMGKWMALVMLMVFITGFITINLGNSDDNSGPFIVALIVGFLTFFIPKFMPRKNAWGYSLHRQAKGLQYYLSKGKWREEIAEKKLFLGETLPLAVALGVVDKVAAKMKALGIKPPEYFGGSNITNFGNDMWLFQRSVTQNAVYAASSTGHSSWSGGSGFSGGGGGGFGGGGGGSW